MEIIKLYIIVINTFNTFNFIFILNFNLNSSYKLKEYGKIIHTHVNILNPFI